MKSNMMLFLLILIYLLVITKCRLHKEEDKEPKDDEPVVHSHTYSKSEIYSSSNVNRKKRKHYTKNESEEHRSKRGNRPAKIRRFQERWHKHNNQPTEIKRRAYTNYPGEKKYLKNKWRKTYLPKEKEKVFFINYFRLT